MPILKSFEVYMKQDFLFGNPNKLPTGIRNLDNPSGQLLVDHLFVPTYTDINWLID